MVFSRYASLLVAAGYLVAAFLVGGGETVLFCAPAVALPLWFIWFPEPFGSYAGPADMGYINRPTPAVFVALGGWLLLLVVPAGLLLTRW